MIEEELSEGEISDDLRMYVEILLRCVIVGDIELARQAVDRITVRLSDLSETQEGK